MIVCEQKAIKTCSSSLDRFAYVSVHCLLFEASFDGTIIGKVRGRANTHFVKQSNMQTIMFLFSIFSIFA